MAAMAPAPPALSRDDSQATFEDVMAFLDGFDVITDLSDPPMAAIGDDGVDLPFPGFSLDEDMLFVHPDELLGLLDATIITTEPEEAQQTGNIPDMAAPFTERMHETAPADDKQARPVKVATRKRNAYREKMKRELQYLRVRTAEMEEQLAALRQGDVTALSPEDKQQIDSSWRRIAKNQLDARVAAEDENVRLKSVLQGHMEMAKTMQQSLGKRIALDDEVMAPKPKPKRGRAMGTPWDDEGFTSLADDLDATFDRLHQVMKESGLDQVAVGSSRSFTTKTMISASGVETPYIELIDMVVAPFHPRLTAKAVWRSLLQQYFHQSRADYGVQKIWQTGSTFAVKCRSKHRLHTQGDRELYLQCKVVVRKYIDEENRMVLVWRALNEGEDEHAGVYADETGWSVLQPISEYCGLSASGSVIRSCVHVVHRHREEPSSLQDPSADLLTELVVASNEEDMRWLTKSVENLLLGQVSVGAQGGNSVGI